MADYISREAAIQFFYKWKDDLDKQIDHSVAYPHLRNDYKVCKTQLLDCIYVIKEMPAADVRPVVRGKWKHDGSDWKNRFICDQCGYKWFFEAEEARFCPNCGADMRGGET